MNSLGRLLSSLFDVYARQHHAGDSGGFTGAGGVCAGTGRVCLSGGMA